MIKLKTILTVGVMCIPQVFIHAATNDQTEIDINVTHTPYVKLIGSAPGSSRFYGNNDIANWIFPSIVDLGTMGLESNVAGNCDMNFSTVNNFQLLHTVSNNSLTPYKVIYQNTNFSNTSNPTLNISCNTIPTTIEFSPTQIVFGNIFPALFIEAGVYQDTITVVVATQ
jgi:hypothetical protein